MKQPTFHVIFRACDKVAAVNKQPRPFDLSKSDLIRICFKSLYDSIQHVPHTITVLGDKLSDDMMAFFSGFNVELSNGDYGNDESIRQSVQKALTFTNDEDWIYFCEDDYLHREETFRYIANLIDESGGITPGKRKLGLFSGMLYLHQPELAIFPTDYPDRYWPQDLTQHYIFHTKDCHWRQVNNTTFTFMLQLRNVKRFQRQLMKSAHKANDGYLSRALFGKHHFINKLLCLSPLPSLTAHMHVNTLSPLVDWEALVRKHSK